ncbi:MAG TPA: hypothetical protein VGJ44_01535 [Kribbellaceae bacterium]|jgi:hypothetical protein
MKIYAELPVRRTRQVIADLVALAWVSAGAWLAKLLYDGVSRLAAPGRKLESTGTSLADQFADAGRQARKVPGVGRSLATPFEGGVDAADAITRAGRSYQDAIHTAAVLTAVLVLVIVLLVVLVAWFPFRARYARRATIGAQLRADPAGQDLLALRALATRPLRLLRSVGDDPVGDWRSADPTTVNALAALELRAVGLRPRRS